MIERLSKLLSRPGVSAMASLALLIVTALSSFLLGAYGVAALLAAGALLLVGALSATAIGLLAAQSTQEALGVPGLSELPQQWAASLDVVSNEIRSVQRRVDTLIRAVGTGDPAHAVLTEAQYAALEASPSVTEVIIAIPVMGNEFDDDLDKRDSLIDYAAIVTENLERRVRYTYVCEKTGTNSARVRRVVGKVGALSEHVRVALVEPTEWRSLPFAVDTAFLRNSGQSLQAYMLLPNGASKADRLWVQLNPDLRDHWWGQLQEYHASAQPV